MILLSAIDYDECIAAYNWHRGFAGANDALFPRSRENFEDLVMNGSVWAARSPSGDYLALAYASFNETDKECEIGGLMVAAQTRGKGLGTLVMRLALAHALLEENLLADPDVRIVAHVLASNQMPRRIIEDQLRFVHSRVVEIPAEALPGLKADEDGFIRGDEFELSRPGTLLALAQWARSWDGKLADGHVADIELRSGITLAHWAEALEDIAATAPAPAKDQAEAERNQD